MNSFNFECISQKIDTEAETIASEILDSISYDPQLAHEIGHLLIEYAERDVAEALAESISF